MQLKGWVPFLPVVRVTWGRLNQDSLQAYTFLAAKMLKITETVFESQKSVTILWWLRG